MFSELIISAAQEHGKQMFPQESVGIVVGEVYIPLQNISDEPENHFTFDKATWIKYGKVSAVIHSHPNGNLYPSACDMENQIITAVPWGLFVCDNERASDILWFGDGTPRPPLFGPERYFHHGINDCYSLIRDYYKQEMGIQLLEFPRDWEWWNEDTREEQKDLYVKGFGKTGFRAIPQSEIKPGDVFLASIGRASKNGTVNHGGIYLGGSGEIILHHLCGLHAIDKTRVAAREPGIRYLSYVTHWLRHEEVL